jgi:iron(III) transport system substrate-binding protein
VQKEILSMNRMTVLVLAALVMAGTAFATGSQEGESVGETVNVYSHRHYDVDRELYEEFTAQTGIEVNVVQAGADELIQRLKREGENTRADVLVTTDAGRLYRAKEMGLLQAVDSQKLEENIPSYLRDPEGYWYGLTKRARVIAYHKDRVDEGELSTYEALAEPRWEDRIAVRSSSNIYNISLLASLVAHHGTEQARSWASGVVENMARAPQGNDRDQMKAVAAGQADIAIVNTYYVGLMATSSNPEEVEVAEQIGVFFPNQDGRGAHINISGAGVTQHAPNGENAIRLIEYLSGTEAQERFAKANYEYPVKPGVPAAEVVQSWGNFTEDRLNLSALGEHQSEAVRIFDQVGWR